MDISWFYGSWNIYGKMMWTSPVMEIQSETGIRQITHRNFTYSTRKHMPNAPQLFGSKTFQHSPSSDRFSSPLEMGLRLNGENNRGYWPVINYKTYRYIEHIEFHPHHVLGLKEWNPMFLDWDLLRVSSTNSIHDLWFLSYCQLLCSSEFNTIIQKPRKVQPFGDDSPIMQSFLWRRSEVVDLLHRRIQTSWQCNMM